MNWWVKEWIMIWDSSNKNKYTQVKVLIETCLPCNYYGHKLYKFVCWEKWWHHELIYVFTLIFISLQNTVIQPSQCSGYWISNVRNNIVYIKCIWPSNNNSYIYCISILCHDFDSLSFLILSKSYKDVIPVS